jgi:hypothetical protein
MYTARTPRRRIRDMWLLFFWVDSSPRRRNKGDSSSRRWLPATMDGPLPSPIPLRPRRILVIHQKWARMASLFFFIGWFRGVFLGLFGECSLIISIISTIWSLWIMDTCWPIDYWCIYRLSLYAICIKNYIMSEEEEFGFEDWEK